MDEQMIVDYLLGVLPESEAERLDEMSVTDEEFAVRLSAAEKDLVDSYVRGELSGDALTNFKRSYLASSSRREKVAFSEAFVHLVDQPAAQKSPRVSSVFYQWGFAAAAIFMLVVTGYFLFENVRLRNQLAQTRADYSALQQRERELQQKLTQENSSNTDTEMELARVRQRLAELEKQLPDDEQPAEKIIAFFLSPQSRGITRLPLLTIPGKTDSIAFTLELESDDFPFYQAVLKNPADDKVLWRSDKLKAGDGSKLQTKLPANILKPQNYFVELYGISPDGTVEIVTSYPFKVVRP